MVVPVMWRTQKQRYSLQAEVCTQCSNAVFPPRAVCPYCMAPMRAHIVVEKSGPMQQDSKGREFVYAIPAALNRVATAAGDD